MTASGRVFLTSARVSRPSMRSIQMSRKVRSGSSSAKNRTASAPLPTAETRYPSSSSTSRRVDRMAGSSSTIRMCSPATLPLLAVLQAQARSRAHGCARRPRYFPPSPSVIMSGGLDRGGSARHRQLHHEAGAGRLVVLDPDRPAVLGHDLVYDRQAQSHARDLRGEVREEESLAILVADARAVVGHDDPGMACLRH